jgi:hypothetical protein
LIQKSPSLSVLIGSALFDEFLIQLQRTLNKPEVSIGVFMLPILASIVSGLISNNLPKVADAVLEKGVDYVQDKLGVELKPESELTPADVEKIRAESMKHEEFMAELDEKSRQRATDMQIRAMDSSDPFVRRFIYYFAWFWAIISVSYFFGVTFIGVADQGGRDFANTILGFLLGTAVSGLLQFFYGSSKSSQDKTKSMQQAIDNVSKG